MNTNYNQAYGLPPYNPNITGYKGHTRIISRPPNSLAMPKDLHRGEFCTAEKNKYQKWCSEDNAVGYYAMQPIIQPNDYNAALSKLFKTMPTGKAMDSFEHMAWRHGLPDKFKSNMFCSRDPEQIVKVVVDRINKNIHLVPELNKSGPFGSLYFYYTQPILVYYFTGNQYNYYNVIFTLYNPLRSIGTKIQTILMETSTSLDIVYMEFVNNQLWSDNDIETKGIYNNMDSRSIDVSGSLTGENLGNKYSSLDWHFGNTVEKQSFNEHGFYEQGKNVQIVAGIPDSLRAKIRNVENTYTEYIEPSTTVGYQGYGISTNQKGLYQNDAYTRTIVNDKIPVYKVNMDGTVVKDPIKYLGA